MFYWILASLLLTSSTLIQALQLLPGCTTESQPNPIKAQYTDKTTGALNGTIAILPIPVALVRSIVPSKYNILQHAYRQFLPTFPEDMFPALLQLELDHDVGTQNQTIIPSFQRASISFPFIDRLNDNHTCMSYSNYILISANQPVALLGAGTYGNTVVPAAFDPPCDAYAFENASSSDRRIARRDTYFDAYAAPRVPGQKAAIGSVFRSLESRDENPYSMAFYRNITNQPQFSTNPFLCDNFIRLFNTSSNAPPYNPIAVRGNVSAMAQYLTGRLTGTGAPSATGGLNASSGDGFTTGSDGSYVWTGMYGLNIANGFIENNFMACESLRGYAGTGGNGD